MIKVFNLPDLGEGLTESEVVAWKVTPGQSVALNEIIAEVETAKAVVELPSPFTGTISALHADPGTVVEVRHPLVSFDVVGADDVRAVGEMQPQLDGDRRGAGVGDLEAVEVLQVAAAQVDDSGDQRQLLCSRVGLDALNHARDLDIGRLASVDLHLLVDSNVP